MKKTEGYKHFRKQMKNFHGEYESPDSTNYTFRDMMSCWDEAYNFGSTTAFIVYLIIVVMLGIVIAATVHNL